MGTKWRKRKDKIGRNEKKTMSQSQSESFKKIDLKAIVLGSLRMKMSSSHGFDLQWHSWQCYPRGVVETAAG